MRTAFLTALIALILAFALGLIAQHRLPAIQATDEIKPVPASWYAELPIDPAQATAAYLARVPNAMRERGDAVSQSRYWVLAARITVSLGAILIFLYSGGGIALDHATRVIRWPWLQAFAYAIVLLVYVFLATLPVEVCASYIRWRIVGFSTQSFIGWLQDDIIGWASTAIFYAIGITILIKVIRGNPRSWFLWAGVVYFVLALVYTLATPAIIEPLTNSFTPLPDSPLKREILALAEKAGVPTNNIYTDDASRQSSRLNAHVSGAFGMARITIDDTALASPPGEIEAIAGHEMGHYVMHHVLKAVLWTTVIATLGFALIAWLEPLLLMRLGRRWGITHPGDTGGIAVFWLLFTAWGFISDPLTNSYIRIQETQADAFSLRLAHQPFGLADFFIHDADIARLTPTMLDVILFYDHPSDALRIYRAMQWRALNQPGG